MPSLGDEIPCWIVLVDIFVVDNLSIGSARIGEGTALLVHLVGEHTPLLASE